MSAKTREDAKKTPKCHFKIYLGKQKIQNKNLFKTGLGKKLELLFYFMLAFPREKCTFLFEKNIIKNIPHVSACIYFYNCFHQNSLIRPMPTPKKTKQKTKN